MLTRCSCQSSGGLDKAVAFGASRVELVVLKDDLLKLAIRDEDLLEVLLRHAEVDVANIE